MGSKIQMQDWPYLNKYQKENSKLLVLEPGHKRIVFMGDSITEFWFKLCPDFFKEYTYINRGISGQTTPQMLIRFRADVIHLKPTIVIILAGGNDIAENTGPSTLEMILNNIISMTELANVNQIKVILCSVLPANNFPWKPNQNPAKKIVSLNTMIKKYAVTNGFYYLDYYSAMVDEEKGINLTYSDDGVHPNKTGYEVMGPLIEKAIKNILLKNN